MADRPIIFSAPMVRALLDGRKTQTRRVLKPQPPERPAPNCHPSYKQKHPAPYLDAYCGERATAANPRGMSRDWHWWQVDDRPGPVACRAPYAPGDRLWVREAWAVSGDFAAINSFDWAKFHDPRRMFQENLRFRADADAYETAVQAWRYPIHMPRWASRLTLIVTDVQVQRLQEISEDDARAEGVLPDGFEGYRGHEGTIGYPTAIWAFRHIWNSIHGPDAWDANPWVAAISFTVHRCNIDTMEEGTW